MSGGARPPRPPRRRVDGVLLLDKPLGLSSNAALQRAKRLLAAEKAGHTGTLDPLATGLLPLCFGEATKFAHTLLDARKEYVATAALRRRDDDGRRRGRDARAPCDATFSRDDLVGGAAAFRRRDRADAAARSRRSSTRAATTTNTRAPASRFRARRARSGSTRSSSSTGRRRRPCCASPAARAPTSACSPRTLRRRSAAARTSRRCAGPRPVPSRSTTR